MSNTEFKKPLTTAQVPRFEGLLAQANITMAEALERWGHLEGWQAMEKVEDILNPTRVTSGQRYRLNLFLDVCKGAGKSSKAATLTPRQMSSLQADIEDALVSRRETRQTVKEFLDHLKATMGYLPSDVEGSGESTTSAPVSAPAVALVPAEGEVTTPF